MVKKNVIIEKADEMMAENEWDLEEYLEYIEEMDAQDFRKYYGRSDYDEAREVLTARAAS